LLVVVSPVTLITPFMRSLVLTVLTPLTAITVDTLSCEHREHVISVSTA